MAKVADFDPMSRIADALPGKIAGLRQVEAPSSDREGRRRWLSIRADKLFKSPSKREPPNSFKRVALNEEVRLF
ncbi:MAG TPA: hypothetical protein ENF73_04235 [Proteobacteria bacterium]|nr:hypothetical protein [Pseudomonadota bacterium]